MESQKEVNNTGGERMMVGNTMDLSPKNQEQPVLTSSSAGDSESAEDLDFPWEYGDGVFDDDGTENFAFTDSSGAYELELSNLTSYITIDSNNPGIDITTGASPGKIIINPVKKKIENIEFLIITIKV